MLGDFLRLQIFLSHSGVCSRRKALDLIQTGHVTVNGARIVKPSTPINPQQDKVCLDGKLVGVKKFEYILLNKPAGITTTKKDRFAKRTVMDILPKSLCHLHPVGRLDKDTEGLLLLTNDGSLTHKLTHPRFEVEKTYFVQAKGRLQLSDVRRLENGMIIDNIKTASAKIRDVVSKTDRTDFFFTIHEGRKRQIRVMMHKVGHPVLRLKRLTQGPLKLGSLKPGEFRHLTMAEIEKVQRMISH